jgi:curved DNA-binding protein CbpA
MNLYDVLELNQNANEIEIKKAYHRLVKKYHPDKNNTINTTEKFLKIQSAYEILINESTRNKYGTMQENEKSSFNDFLDKIINNNIDLKDFLNYCNHLTNKDIEDIHDNFYHFIKNFTTEDILNLVKDYIIPKDYINNSFLETDSDVDIFADEFAKYYYILPINIQKYNELDIKIELNINLSDIIKYNKRKIKIKRNINNNSTFSTFIFNLNYPYIVFINLGDINNDNYGNLIIKLNLDSTLYWNHNTIVLNKYMTLYQMIYGLDIIVPYHLENINISNWKPCEDGMIININDKYNLDKCKYNIIIKLFLNYEDNEQNREILKQYFS